MLTITLCANKKKPLYEQIYDYIQQSINNGQLKSGERLPSKRNLADHLKVSVNTVENAYAQLLAEGYINSAEKKGYFVRPVEKLDIPSKKKIILHEKRDKEQMIYRFDMKTNAVDTNNFPFSVWAKLCRQSLHNDGESLLEQQHFQGNLLLRYEIARYLEQYRGMNVLPEQIVLGSGIEYLLGLITELLPNAVFALEHPCYLKQVQILQSKQVRFTLIPMGEEGIRLSELRKSPASVALITPSRHFPLGTITSINQRMQLIKWASEEKLRYLIEDDFDCEYRYTLKQIPSIYSLDTTESVLYLNTFARTLAPSLRIAYMVLPPSLLLLFQEKMRFYSCTVSSFEQNVLRRFLEEGYYERHLNRMRIVYRKRRDAFLQALSPLKHKFTIRCHEAGLHLLIQSLCGMTEEQMVLQAKQAGIKVYGLSRYYWEPTEETNTVIIGYGKFNEDALEEIAKLLVSSWS